MTPRACLRPDRDPVLKPTDRLWGLRHQRPKHQICTAEFGLRAPYEIVARHQRAVERAGESFEPARGVHGRTDYRKFKTGQPDVAQHDGPVMQTKTDEDWSLAGRFAFAAPPIRRRQHSLRTT